LVYNIGRSSLVGMGHGPPNGGKELKEGDESFRDFPQGCASCWHVAYFTEKTKNKEKVHRLLLLERNCVPLSFTNTKARSTTANGMSDNVIMAAFCGLPEHCQFVNC